jgi:hypothetical protein
VDVTRPRKLLWAGLAVFALLGALSLPAVHWRLAGWWRGEPFYRGRPVSWWAGELSTLYALFDATGVGVTIPECYRPDCLLPDLRRRMGWVVPTRQLRPADVPFAAGNPDALPVLLDLLAHPDSTVRAHAAHGLSQLGPAARDAVPSLRRLRLLWVDYRGRARPPGTRAMVRPQTFPAQFGTARQSG